MAEAVSKIVADVRGTYPNASPDLVLDLVNSIHQELCSTVAIDTSTIDVSLTAGQREYPIGANVSWIRAARYMESADAWHALRPASAEELDSASPGWRWAQPSGPPTMIYVDGGNIGLHPVPPTTTSGGYPKVEIVAATHSVLTHQSFLPEGIHTRLPWVHGARMLYALMHDKQNAPVFEALYQRSVEQLRTLLGGRNRYHRRVPRPSGFGGVRQI